MFFTWKSRRQRIAEHRRGFVKLNAMFAEIRFGFLRIPSDYHSGASIRRGMLGFSLPNDDQPQGARAFTFVKRNRCAPLVGCIVLCRPATAALSVLLEKP